MRTLSKKILFIGGHLAPALAVIDVLPKETQIVFVGRKNAMEQDTTLSLEYQTVKKRGIRFIALTTGRLRRHLSVQSVISLFKIPYGFVHAFLILLREKPQVVVGFGGYLSVPLCITARILGIKVVIHEQTLRAGLANRVSAPFAHKICVSWEQSKRFFPVHKTILTGNPIRKMAEKKLVRRFDKPIIYITGGSTGSHAINTLVLQTLEYLLEKYVVFHQTGDAYNGTDYADLTEKITELPSVLKKRYEVMKFVPPEHVGMLMRHADLIVSRSGMNTVSELLAFGKPCLLIPLPSGQHNEQLLNAQFVKKVGIGEYLEETKTTPKLFLSTIETMFDRLSRYKVYAASAKSLIKTDAAERIREVIKNV